jgi:hypothetical protein
VADQVHACHPSLLSVTPACRSASPKARPPGGFRPSPLSLRA